ncbi:MAG TPA: acetamidase [Clostridiales bacterium]|jgi:acetamidase/formamidase|nr:acetamidase [Clostridiales bacterium]
MVSVRKIDPQKHYAYAFDRNLEPVAYVDPGEILQIATKDAFSDQLTCESQKPSDVNQNINPQSGPFYINGAKPGDCLKIKIISIEPTRDWGVSAVCVGYGGLVGTRMTRMIMPPLEEKVWIYKRQADGSYYHSEKLHFPWQPFVGTIATADKLEVVSAVSPYHLGGNMDVKDVCPGNTIYLPVEVDGGMLFLGDCHACQGDGELNGVALEIAAEVVIQVEIIKDKSIRWPRIESDSEIMVVGSARPMEDAARIAYAELIDWLCEDYGWDMIEAYQLLGQCGSLYVGNMVDTWYSLVAKVNKKYL